MDLLEKKALDFATKKHLGQKRKFENLPYISHPVAVSNILKKYTNNLEIIIAALLHDVIEDTNTNIEEIIENFGENIAKLVLELTTNKKDVKEIGKAQYLSHKINNISSSARLIKFADRYHNLSSLDLANQEFKVRYSRETEYILNHIVIIPSKIEKELINKIWEKIKQYI